MCYTIFMEDKMQRCQSCGIPLGEAGFYGSEKDGLETREYCKFCYQYGTYVEKDISLEQMIERSVAYMTTQLGFEETKAREVSKEIISSLKRWQR